MSCAACGAKAWNEICWKCQSQATKTQQRINKIKQKGHGKCSLCRRQVNLLDLTFRYSEYDLLCICLCPRCASKMGVPLEDIVDSTKVSSDIIESTRSMVARCFVCNIPLNKRKGKSWGGICPSCRRLNSRQKKYIKTDRQNGRTNCWKCNRDFNTNDLILVLNNGGTKHIWICSGCLSTIN